MISFNREKRERAKELQEAKDIAKGIKAMLTPKELRDLKKELLNEG